MAPVPESGSALAGVRQQQGFDPVQLALLRKPEPSFQQRPDALMEWHDLAQQLAGRCLRMTFSKADGGLPDLLNLILADAGNRKVRKQVIDVIRRDSLAGNRLVG